MKRIFSIFLALMLVISAVPSLLVEAEAFMIPSDEFYIEYNAGKGASGGSSIEGPFSVEDGATLKSAEALGFSKEGYEFTKWSIGKPGNVYKPSSGGKTVTATAQWEKISSSTSSSGSSSSSSSSSSSTASKERYCVTYYPGEAPGKTVKKYYDYGENFSLISCSFKYEDHTFLGWEYSDGRVFDPGTKVSAPNADVSFTAVWGDDGVKDIVASGSSSSSSSSAPSSSASSSAPVSSAPSSSASSSKPASSSSSSSSKPVSSSSSSSESSEPESSSSSSSVVEEPVEDVFEPINLAFSINGDIPVTKIEFVLKEDIGGNPTINLLPLDGYSVTDEAAAKLIADGDALAAFDISILVDGMAYNGDALGTVVYSLNGTQANAEANYKSYVFAMAHTTELAGYSGEYYMTDGELVYLYNPETDFKTAVDNVALVEEDGVYRLVIKDPSGLSAFAYKASESTVVEIKLVPNPSAESASIDVTSLSPVLLIHLEVGEGKAAAAGVPFWIWIIVGVLVILIAALVVLFIINRKNENNVSSAEKHSASSGSYSGITGFDDEE